MGMGDVTYAKCLGIGDRSHQMMISFAGGVPEFGVPKSSTIITIPMY